MDLLITSIRACARVPDGTTKPAAILWTDPNREWKSIQDEMLSRLPELLVLGDYSVENRTGPAIWIRCIIDGALNLSEIPDEAVPIIYLPSVAKQDLRAGKSCPPSLMPLVELMYRGTMWLQYNGKDWTTTAFLTTPKEGISLDIATDRSTQDALNRALREVFTTPLVRLDGKRLGTDEFDKFLSDDPIRELLRWLSEPEKKKSQMSPDVWGAFRSQCKKQYQFDPDDEGALIVGEKLGLAEGPWADVWERYSEAPSAWPGIYTVLQNSRPTDRISDRFRWPDLNDEDEMALRESLADLDKSDHSTACKIVLDLEERHGERRNWIWAQLGLSPMAAVIEQLARIATISIRALGGGTPNEIADSYEQGVWYADAASWKAITIVPISDRLLISTVVRTLMGEWLDLSARAFQQSLENQQLPSVNEYKNLTFKPGTCILFVDGLRYDLARILSDHLREDGCNVDMTRRWGALPTVTATAKPAVTPVVDQIIGRDLPNDFTPMLIHDNKPATTQALRELLIDYDYQVIDDLNIVGPLSKSKIGWMETGKIDSKGHNLGNELPTHLEEELEMLRIHISSLLEAGWIMVYVLTDHGWLWLPGGLPKVELPKHLTRTKWNRSAVIESSAQVKAKIFPWYWNSTQYFATAPGIGCFYASQPYSHGGISLQECLLCDLQVERDAAPIVKASIKTISWRRFRCDIATQSNGAGVIYADLRLLTVGGKSIITTPKTLDGDGLASLLVENDDYEGENVILVLMDEGGNFLAHSETTVGGQSNG
jgi:hypothetical protein